MSIIRDFFCFAVPLTMLFANVLSFATGVGDCTWPIFARTVLVEVSFWRFSNNPLSFAFVADATTFVMMLHATCTGPFSMGISWIGALKFGPRKNIFQFCFMSLILICRMHRSICGESFRFFFILLLRLDMLRCNLKTEWFVYEVFSYYIYPILQLVIFLVASDCYFRKLFVSRGMVSPEIVSFFCVGNNVVLRVHNLELKVVPFLFHSLTLVLSQCKTFLPSLWLPCILFLVLISGVKRALSPNI